MCKKICHEFENLTINEKRDFIGKITHLAQTSSDHFNIFCCMLITAECFGDLDGVKIIVDENNIPLSQTPISNEYQN